MKKSNKNTIYHPRAWLFCHPSIDWYSSTTAWNHCHTLAWPEYLVMWVVQLSWSSCQAREWQKNETRVWQNKVEMFCQNISNKSKGFTLVELIIVITILAILSTIAFISFQWYTKNARDSNRTSTLTNLQKWLDIYSVQVWILPEPEWNVVSWSLNWVQLTKVWIVWDNISRLIKLNKTATDPVSGNNYAYWVSADNKYYQIWVTLENLESYSKNYNKDVIFELNKNVIVGLVPTIQKSELIWLTGYSGQARIWQNEGRGWQTLDFGLLTKTTYADNGSYKAKVIWNYKYPLKLWNKLYSLPSLLFTWTWWELSQTGNAYFIVDKWLNIPYTPDKSPLNNTQSTTLSLQQVVWTWWLSLTWITLPSITSEEFKALTNTSTTLQSLQQNLWITDQTQLWNVIYWSSYNTNTSISAVSWWGGWALPTCTNFTYSARWACQPNNTQTRTITVSLPSWCTWWSPEALSQSCTYVDPTQVTQAICTAANWDWIPNTSDVYIWTARWNWYCISPTVDLNKDTEWSWNTWLNGISRNGWWNNSNVYLNWWNTESYASTRDTWLTSYYIYWQTKTLNSPSWYTCKALWTATKWLTLSDSNNAVLSDNPDSTNPSEDTLENRMRYLAKYKNNHTKFTASNIDWIEFSVAPLNNHAIPALYLSDCIDWAKDLWETMTYKHSNNTTENVTYAQ